jgi:Flp pilus assembly protein TadD
MPQLNAIHWIILLLFQAFYGFAVFTLTKEHYQRHGAAPVTATMQATGVATQPRSSPLTANSLIPDSVTQNNPQLLAKLGDERFSERRYQEAAEIYRRLLTLTPNDADAHNDLGLALHYLGRSDEALKVLKRGVEKDPQMQRIWLTLGFVQMHSAEKTEARFTLQHAVEMQANNSVGQEAQRLLEVMAR